MKRPEDSLVVRLEHDMADIFSLLDVALDAEQINQDAERADEYISETKRIANAITVIAYCMMRNDSDLWRGWGAWR